MKKIFIALFAALAIFTSCEKEGRLNLPPEQPRYNLADDPNDPVQHFVYETYQKYGVIVVTNPTIADYKFNFSSDNGIVMTAPPQDRDVLMAGIGLLKEIIFDKYPENFLKQNLPVTIIMANTINMASYGETYEMASYVARNYLAISHINEELPNLTAEEKQAIDADANSKLWATYMTTMLQSFSVPEDFYNAGIKAFPDEDYYEFYWEKDPAEIDFYSYGFIWYDEEASFIEPDWFWYDVYGPDKNLDVLQWIKFILGTSKSEIDEICNKYPIMKQKYEILSAAMADAGYSAE